MMPDKITVIHSFPVWLTQTQTWMYNQVKYLPSNIEVHIVCERTQHLDQFTVAHIHSLKSTSRLQYIWERSLRKLEIRDALHFLTSMIRKTGACVVHSHFGHIGWMNLKSLHSANAKHIVTFYGADVSFLPSRDKRWLARYKELFSQTNLFLCEGPHMANQLIRLGCPREKVLVHHLGVEIENIPYKPRRWQEGEPLRVLVAASFREKKGIPYALKALGQFQHEVPLEITIIGDADSERRSKEEKQHILDILETDKLKSKTRLLGYQPYSVLFDEAYKHHVFISPSVTASDGDTEGGAPVSIIEMMATGMPVVSTMHCDIPEVVQYSLKNWLANERDVTGLVNNLQWLTTNATQWDELLSVGRRYVELEFDARRQGKYLEKIYQDVLNH